MKSNLEGESDSMASEDDGGGRKEEMKKSIFGKRRSDENAKLDQHKKANPFSFKVKLDNYFIINVTTVVILCFGEILKVPFKS